MKTNGDRASTPQEIANRLRERLRVTKEHAGYFKALCPAHENTDPKSSALSVMLHADGVGVRCHGNPQCSTAAILDAVGMRPVDLFVSARLVSGNGKPKARTRETRDAATYTYLDADGRLHMRVQRTAAKDFFQQTPTDSGGWENGLNGRKPILYHADKIAHEYDKAAPLFIVEGERDADRLIAEGLQATTSPMGAGKWRAEYANQIEGYTDVRVLPDNDDPGREHAEKIAASLPGAKIVNLPGLPHKGDVSDWLDAGHTAGDLVRIEPVEASEATEPTEPKPETGKRRNQPDRLIDYALASGVELFVDQVGAPHVRVGAEAVPLTTRANRWLRGLMWDAEKISVSTEALKTAAGTLAAFAVEGGVVHELHTRAAFMGGVVYYQLRPGRLVRIDRDGWRLLADEDAASAPALFRSVPNLRGLPDPTPGVGVGDIDALDRLINLKTDRDRRMVRAYALTVALPHIPRPMLQTTGVTGSGKTTAGRVIKRLLDPTAPETVRPDSRDFIQKCSHAFIVMLDNQNSLPEWAVDVLCRLVTGEADSKRSLYTDDDDFIYEMRRAVILNGINAPADRGDAQDRTLPIELDRIDKKARRSEAALWAEFDRMHARLLGAVFDGMAKTLRIKETQALDRLPRLADWGEYAAAAYSALGHDQETFFADWREVEDAQNEGVLDGSPLAQAIAHIMDREPGDEWRGSASGLLAALRIAADELQIDTRRDPAWPSAPGWVWKRMRDVLPLLGSLGIEAAKGHTERGSLITLRKTDPEPPPDPDSRNGATVSSTVRRNGAYLSAPDNPDGTDSKQGFLNPLNPKGEKGGG